MSSKDGSNNHDNEPSVANSADLPNPYEFAHPVKDFAHFAGRASELEDIRYYLRQAKQVTQPVNLAIIGERASGKTSLLNMIGIEGQAAGLLTARINLNSADADPINLFWKLYDAVIETVSRAGFLFRPGSDEDITYRRIIDGLDPTADCPGFPLRFPAHYAASVNGSRQISEPKLQRDLAYIANQTSRTTVLLFDECNVLTKNRVALEMLRNIFMDTPGYLLVLTGTPSFFPLLDDVFSPIIRQYKKITIAPFSNREETEACIQKPLKAIGINPRNILQPYWRVSYDVHAISGGRPYEIQLLCHFMFRRVQEDRAQYMKLTADVIDDVLRELETSINQEAVDRPIISAVRKLTKPQLGALNIFGRSTNATFEQEWFLYALSSSVSPDESNISHEALAVALDKLVSLGILKVDDDKISFVGDDFDRTYIRYHAERAGISVNLASTRFPTALRMALNRALRLFLGDVVVNWGNDEIGSSPLEALTSLLDPKTGVVTESITMIIKKVLKALPYGQLVLSKVTVTYDSVSVYAWLASEEKNHIDFNQNRNLARLSQVIEDNNGELTVEEFEFPLPSQEVVFDRILSSDNKRLARAIGDNYILTGAKEYLIGKREMALSKVERGIGFPLSAAAANDAGYMKLASGEYRLSEELFARAVILALEDDDFKRAALAMYNRGAAHIMLNDRASALKYWEEARNQRADHPRDSFELACLFVPKISSGKLVMGEIKGLELFATIEDAVSTLASLADDRTIPELELNSDMEN